MSVKTGISWTDATWNPIRGCSRVSEGCRNCYAEKVANRFCAPGSPYDGVVQIGADGKGTGKWNGQVKFVEKRLLDPLRWKAGRRIFVNSMSDLFHENVTDEMRDRIFAVMALCPQHTFQVLTKRPERMLAYLTDDNLPDRVGVAIFDLPEKLTNNRPAMVPVPDRGALLQNVHLGVSVENQKTADERIPLLLQTPAAVRFISAEPLLGPVDLENLPSHSGIGRHFDSLNNGGCEGADIPTKLDWVIVGGESGPGGRPMHPDWARSLRDQCKAAGVPFFFKQWGEWRPCGNQPNRTEWCDGLALVNSFTGDIRGMESLSDETTEVMRKTGTKIAGCLLDGVEHHEFPAVRA